MPHYRLPLLAEAGRFLQHGFKGALFWWWGFFFNAQLRLTVARMIDY